MNNNFKKTKFETPVLFLVFNRPETTSKVFEMIRKAKPPRIYIACDGPRNNRKNEIEKIAEVKKIVTNVDWTCQVYTLFRNRNLGCKKAVSEAISWFFKNENQGIILEDDCLPHIEFFSFCEELLNYYKEDEKIICITGDNFQEGKIRSDASYYFSKYNHCWGWATWRRAWKKYDGDLINWPNWSKSDAWLNHTSDKLERKFWSKIFNQVYSGKIDTWDYSWLFSAWFQNALTVTPNVNLVSNIGFGPNSTHTNDANDKAANIPTKEVGVINHPISINRSVEADRWTFNYHYGGKNLRFPYNWIFLPNRILKYIFRMLKKSKL